MSYFLELPNDVVVSHDTTESPFPSGTVRRARSRMNKPSPAAKIDPEAFAGGEDPASELPPIRVLLVEDSPIDVLLLENELNDPDGGRFEVTVVNRVHDATEALMRKEFDVVLTDLGLPDSAGLDTLQTIHRAADHLPVIVLTAVVDERMGIKAMRAGAQDYFVKGHAGRRGIAHAIYDAIERGRTQQALHRSEERFRSSIDSLMDGFAHLTPIRCGDGAITGFCVDYINASGLEGRADLVPLPSPFTLAELFPDYHERGLLSELVRVAEEGRPFSCESMVLCQNGSKDPTAPSYDFRATRTNEGVALSWRDVTARLRLEAQVSQAQKMNSIGQLAGGIAHDFNNLLTVIHGHADVMRDSKNLPDELAESVRQISNATSRATNLTNQLLTFSRQYPIILTEVDLNETVARMSNVLGRLLGESIHLRVEFRQPAPFVRADCGMIEQILLNLAANSREAMSQGGELSIATTLRRLGEAELESEPDVVPGLFACLMVRDNGCGIARNYLSKIFEPFFSTKEVGKGTGLGLATVYGIVKQHKGWIRVESKVGQGTAFEVYLPSFDAKPVERVPIVEAGKPITGNELVLLVEDEDPIRSVAKMFLEAHGYHVIEARNGPEALNIWRKNRDEIDLLLTDLVMPHGVSGQELARSLQAERPNLKVIYSSGYSCDLFGDSSFLNPQTNFLQKPYRLSSLAEMIRHCLDERASATERGAEKGTIRAGRKAAEL